MADLNIPAATSGTLTTVGRSYSVVFTPSVSTVLDRIQWYRHGSAPFPDRVYIARGANTPLFDALGNTLTWTSIGGGWWEAVLPAPGVTVSAASHQVTYYFESVGTIQGYYSGTISPDSPMTASACYFSNSNTANPTTPAGANVWYGQTPVWGVGQPGSQEPGPDPAADTFGEHAIWWQYGNPDLRQDSLAKLIYDFLGGMADVLAQIDTSTVNLPPLLDVLTTAYLNNLIATIDQVLAEVDNLQAHIVGAGAGGGSAFYGPTGVQVAAGVEQLLAAGPGLSWADGDVLAPANHSLADTFPFTGQVGWGSGYALHRLHFDTTDDKHPMIGLGAAGTWIPGIGWWAAILPDGSLTNRTPCEFQDQWCWPVPSAAVGLVLWVHPSVSGTLEAYAVPPVSP